MSKLSRYNLLISRVQSVHECSHVLNSSIASPENNLIIRRAIEGLTFISEDLMINAGLKEQARDSRLANLWSSLKITDFSKVLSFYKSVYDLIIEHISGKNVIGSYSDFKDQIVDKLGFFNSALLSVIKDDLNNIIQLENVVITNGCYRSPNTKALVRVAQFLCFCKKLNFTDVGLEDKALNDYLEFEAETASYSPESLGCYIKPLQSIIHKWLKDWDYDGFYPHHGPGSVADSCRSKLAKYTSLKSDDKLFYLLREHILDLNGPRYNVEQLDRTSKLVFVPKDISKLRSISMEPSTLQYHQQGCKDSLMDYFIQQRSLHNHIKLEDQFQNKSLAYDGSITDSFATIDLSHASDSVSWALCKVLFKRTPKILKWMLCTRSTHTLLPTGVSIELTKFAPMGSALCFPIETIIFAAIAKLSISLSKEIGADRDDSTGIRCTNSFFSVYGDDIIVPSYASELCVKILTLAGFTPNNDKSYLHGPFKESCGGNYFCGVDITPLKLSISFSCDSPLGIGPSAYTALVDYANLAYQRGYSLFRLWCIKLIFGAGLSPKFTNDLGDTSGIYSSCATNFHLKTKYLSSNDVKKPNYQKYVYLYDWVSPQYNIPSSSISLDSDDVFLYDYELNFRDIDYLSNGSYYVKKTRQIVFDTRTPYNRGTLYENKLCWRVCQLDV